MNCNYLELPGVGNARELGGYRAGEKKIVGGRLLRTASLCGGDKKGLETFRDTFALQTVIDLRTSAERREMPDPEIPGTANIHLPVLEAEDLMAEADPSLVKKYGASAMDRDNAPSGDHVRDRMEMFETAYGSGMLNDRLYIGFLLGSRGKASWRRFFEELLKVEEGRAFLWHCTDGKDRTGCGAMLILSALGTDRETILQDYMQTNVRIEPMLAGIRKKIAPLGWPEEKQEALLFMSGGVFMQYMENAIAALELGYGSVRGYLQEELGIGGPEIRELQEKFLH